MQSHASRARKGVSFHLCCKLCQCILTVSEDKIFRLIIDFIVPSEIKYNCNHFIALVPHGTRTFLQETGFPRRSINPVLVSFGGGRNMEDRKSMLKCESEIGFGGGRKTVPDYSLTMA